MRLARYAWWLPPLLAIGGFALVSATDLCRSPGTWIGPRPMTCDLDFIGMTLSTQAAGWLAAGIGGVLGTTLALVLRGETAAWTWSSVRNWITRMRLVIIGGALLLVGGLAALSWFDSHTPRSTPKIWDLQPGETLRVPADQVIEEDEWACSGGGRVLTPPPGQVSGNDVFTVKVDLEGNVVVHCERRPPENV